MSQLLTTASSLRAEGPIPPTFRLALHPAIGLRFRGIPTVLLLLIGAASPVGAQRWDLSVRLDNDFFVGFSPTSSTDHEYTHGSIVTLRKGDRCQRCLEQVAWSMAVAHLIFTPREVGAVGERRPAGWLRAALSRTVVDAGWSSRTFGLVAGLVGPAAGGEAVQRATHRLFGFREPTGWSHQLPTRVEIGGWWSHRWPVVSGRGRFGGSVESVISAGTIQNYARVSLAGYATKPSLADLEVSTTIGGRVVFSDYLLTGLNPVRLLAEGSVGVQMRVLGIAVRYELMARTRIYEQEPEGFAYAGIQLGLRW